MIGNIHYFIVITGIRVDELMDCNRASIVKAFFNDKALSFALTIKDTSGAYFVFGDFCQRQFSICEVAIAAAGDGIGIVVGESFPLDSRVEAEHTAVVAGESVSGSFFGLVAGRFGVFFLTDLDGGAPAVPSVRREIGMPEGVGRREGDAMEGSVFGAYRAVVGGAVLEIVTVAVGGELFPTRSHLSGSVGEVVFGAEVVTVVGIVDFLNVVQKLFERLTNTVFIDLS